MTVIVDYEMGNLGSIQNMLKKIGHSSVVSSSPQEISNAKRVILPGVGGFSKGMDQLRKMNLVTTLQEKSKDKAAHLLGICLGMQLLTDYSEEGDREGLGIITAKTTRFQFTNTQQYKVPHIGWNFLKVQRENPYFPENEDENRFYFVHSYRVDVKNKQDSLAKSQYGIEFDSIIQKGNILGCQFHPEKSHKFGIAFFKRWLKATEPAV
jgi:glutamine amidotransferase